MGKAARVRRAHSTVEKLELRQLLSAVKITLKPLPLMEPIALSLRYQGDGITPASSSSPSGITPDQMRRTYGVTDIQFGSIKGDGAGQTLAIIDAYDDPRMISSSLSTYNTSDLYNFNKYYRLPQFGTSGGPTFTKVDQNGGTSYPSANAGWISEITLDVEWAHVIAPKANIVLIEGNSNSFSDLEITAVSTAKAYPGVTAVSMSFGANEFSSETSYDYLFANQVSGHANVAFFASTGDYGATTSKGGGVEFPAVSPYVAAVGGTTLTQSNGVYGSEIGWAYGSDSYNVNGAAGGGISAYESKPSYQSSVTISSTQRTIPDIALDADPSSGVPIYDTYNGTTASPWFTFGGTSLSSPMWGALDTIVNQGLALNGQGSLTTQQFLTKVYASPASYFHDITSGNNGYAAGAGYDLVTGIGTPIANNLIPYLSGFSIASLTSPVLTYNSDSGIDALDKITNVNKPTVTGKTTLSGTVNILVDGVVFGSGTISNGAYSVTLTSAITDGLHTITAAVGGSNSTGTAVTVDTVGPSIASSAFNFLAAAHSLVINFSETLAAAPTTANFVVTNTTTSTAVPTANESISVSGNTATITFPGYTNGTLPQGKYTVALAGTINDIAGNLQGSPSTASFFFLPGDTNHDGKVDIGDLGTLSTNWQKSGDFTKGDFDYSGKVDINDLGILATNWQLSYVTPGALPDVVATVTATPVATAAPAVTKKTAAPVTATASVASPPAAPVASSLQPITTDVDSIVS